MGFRSKNMNYIFNIEYFENIRIPDPQKKSKGSDQESIEKIKERNKDIEQFSFAGNKIPVTELEKSSYEQFTYCSFRLYTKYPGLLTGIGYSHDISMPEAIKCGFLFDYVTGLPYVPGSSLKGMFRSFFPGDQKNKEISQEYEAYVIALLNKDKPLDLQGLKKNLFEYNDVFLGAYPDVENFEDGILKMEYITPHEEFKDPNPISILKVKPNVPFTFSFLLSDYVVDKEIVVSAEEKLDLFKNMILDMGIGAKTNVGFGRFSQQEIEKNCLCRHRQESGAEMPTVRPGMPTEQPETAIVQPYKNPNVIKFKIGDKKAESIQCKKVNLSSDEAQAKYPPGSKIKVCFVGVSGSGHREFKIVN